MTKSGPGGKPGIDRRTLLRGTALAAAVVAGGALLTARPGTARADDFYNPFSGYPITGSWQDHLDDGSLGGIDFGMGVGTELPASGSGTVTNNPDNGTGGYTVTITHPNGYKTQYLHLSQFLLADGAAVGAGTVVGLSGGEPGAPGSGSSTGPHLHWHMIDPGGTRINPLEFLGGDPGGSLPKSSTEQDGVPGVVFWQRTQKWLSIEAGYAGPIDGEPGTNTYAALQRYLNAHHGYAGPIDGDPGPDTYAALQRFAAGYGYTGPIDGEMGPNSWMAVARFINDDRWD